MHTLSRYLPILVWGKRYGRSQLSGDLIAAVIVTIMLIPQSLAYALLAGLPPEAGIYASIVPILLYAVFGTSNALAVGPVAVVSLMTAATVGEVAAQGTAGYAVAALTLALLSGGILLLMGLFRMGFVANFLSHPVIAGFIAASGILIASSQLKHILGIPASGHTLPEILKSITESFDQTNVITLVIGIAATAFLFWVRKGLKRALVARGVNARLADVAQKAGPVAAVVVTTLAVWAFGLDTRGVSIVGSVPQGLPPFTLPSFAPELISALLLPALLISIIGFVRIDLGGRDAGREKAPADRPRPRTDRPRRRQHRRGLHRRLPGHGRFRPFGGQLRRRCRNPCRRRLHRHRPCLRRACADAAHLLPAHGDACRDDHRGRAQPCRSHDPEEYVEVLARRLRRRLRHNPSDTRPRRRGRRLGRRAAVNSASPLPRPRGPTWPRWALSPAPSISATFTDTPSRSIQRW